MLCKFRDEVLAIFVEFVYYCHKKLLSFISVSFKSFVFSSRFSLLTRLQKPDLYNSYQTG